MGLFLGFSFFGTVVSALDWSAIRIAGARAYAKG